MAQNWNSLPINIFYAVAVVIGIYSYSYGPTRLSVHTYVQSLACPTPPKLTNGFDLKISQIVRQHEEMTKTKKESNLSRSCLSYGPLKFFVHLCQMPSREGTGFQWTNLAMI